LVALGRSWRLFIDEPSHQFECTTIIRLGERSLQLGSFVQASSLANRAWELGLNSKSDWTVGEAALLQGQTALIQGNLARADDCLHNALTRARALNLVHLELAALIAIAELRLKQGFPAEAKACLYEVWDAAERGPYRLRQADAYNVLAAIACTERDKPAAIDAAAKAYRAAWCDGPPYAYHWGLAKAKEHIAALGAPEPDMPPFDESKFESMPEVEINPKDEYWVDPKAWIDLADRLDVLEGGGVDHRSGVADHPPKGTSAPSVDWRISRLTRRQLGTHAPSAISEPRGRSGPRQGSFRVGPDQWSRVSRAMADANVNPYDELLPDIYGPVSERASGTCGGEFCGPGIPTFP
jgi:hypothetical protein